MKLLCSLLAVGLLSLACASCSSDAHKSSGTASTSRTRTQDFTKSDRDKDDDGVKGSDEESNDNAGALDFGHEANASDKRAITALVKTYYAAAAAEDGAKACSMIYSTLAESVPEDYGLSPPGPAYAQGKTCAAVLTLIFKHFHNQVVVKLPKLEVHRVRIKQREGLVILRFGTLPEREFHVSREGHTWKIEGLLDNPLP